MKTKIKLITLIIVIISSLFILTGCTSNISEAETESRLIEISRNVTENGMIFYILYDKETKVMYTCGIRKGITVLLDAEGKPLLYEGE